MTIALAGSDRTSPISADAPCVVVGLGARHAAGVDEILALIDRALGHIGLSRSDIALCVTHASKLSHPGLRAAAAALRVPLRAVEPDRAIQPPNPSPFVLEMLGTTSVAEATAMAMGPLLLEKQRSASATCALSRLEQPSAYSSIAASAPSTLSTSWAGP